MPTIPTALRRLPPRARATLLNRLHERKLRALARDFPTWAHPGQLPPSGDWRTWLIMAGRGFGKTRAGAEWVLELVREAGNRGARNSMSQNCLHIALVAATIDEARDVMIEGPSGILSLADPRMIAEWAPSRHYLRFANGSELHLYSGANPEKLRGPQHHFAWCDELAKWKKPQATWNNLQLGLRMGERPRALVTTTPRGCPLLTSIIAAPDTVQSGGSTRANPHLPPAYLAAMEAEYGGTRLGRQELEGELLTDIEGSLWPSALIERSRIAAGQAGNFVRTVVGVDPPASESGTCGIVVAALDKEGKAYVLADCSVNGASPDGWARVVVRAADAWDADRIIAERNQGGDMVRQVLLAASAKLPVELVHASQSKGARAEPVAGQFENGRAFLAGYFPELEAQLGGMTPGGGYQGSGTSPDRADACVWALWALLLKPKTPEPHIRSL
jgi:phage terminase large subunit-like protein